MSPFIALQYLLPHRLLSSIALRIARIEAPWFKNAMIRFIADKFGVDWSEAASADLADYRHFNAFFTRALKPGARVAAGDERTILMPADGRISQCGPIRYGRLFQAKGFDFSAEELLADGELAKRFDGGVFATVYLSPRDYHRVHMPWTGTLRETVHVPGRLFSVAPWTTESIPRLFARNERLELIFDTERGPLAVVLVGAIFVSSIETVFDGEVTPPYADQVRVRDYSGTSAPSFAVGAELGRFNMGSTVIVLTGAQFPAWATELTADVKVRMGQRMSVCPNRTKDENSH